MRRRNGNRLIQTAKLLFSYNSPLDFAAGRVIMDA